ncbi:MAG TPA: IPT/TIG domain-containing protein, partial [Puia sp.]|nr:IPT/TIG domain-containing protein [Puia sp.]
MNRIWIAFAFFCSMSACTKSTTSHDNTFDPASKPVINSFNPMTGPVDTTVVISGANFNPDLTKDIVTFNGITAVIKSGTTTQLVVTVPQGASSGNITVTVDTNTVISTNIFTVTGNRWTLITRFPGTLMDDMASFQLGNKIFIGMGYSNDGPSKEFWQYDLSTGKWTRKADFPGAVPGQNIGFAVRNKGYVIVDLENVSQNLPLWEYDTALDTWTSRANFPQPSLDASMIAFTVDDYAYAGGTNDGFPNHSKNMFRYDPGANA